MFNAEELITAHESHDETRDPDCWICERASMWAIIQRPVSPARAWDTTGTDDLAIKELRAGRAEWMETCDSAEDGHGTDHGSLEAARECTWKAATCETCGGRRGQWCEHRAQVVRMMTSAVSIIYEDEVEPQVWLFESRPAAERFASGVQLIEGYNFLVDVQTPGQVLDGSQVDEALAIFLTNLEED